MRILTVGHNSPFQSWHDHAPVVYFNTTQPARGCWDNAHLGPARVTTRWIWCFVCSKSYPSEPNKFVILQRTAEAPKLSFMINIPHRCECTCHLNGFTPNFIPNKLFLFERGNQWFGIPSVQTNQSDYCIMQTCGDPTSPMQIRHIWKRPWFDRHVTSTCASGVAHWFPQWRVKRCCTVQFVTIAQQTQWGVATVVFHGFNTVKYTFAGKWSMW